MSITKFVEQVFTPTEKEVLIKGLEQNVANHEILAMELTEIGDAPLRNTAIYQRYDRALRTNVHAASVYKGDLVRFLALTANKIEENVGKYTKYIEQSFDREVTRNGLDYRRAHLMQLCAAIDLFYSNLTKFIAVASAQTVKDVYAKQKMTQQYDKELSHDNTVRAMGYIVALLWKKPSELEAMLKDMKDIPFVEDRANEITRVYKDRLDPMKSGLAPGFGHIAVFIGGLINEWQTYRRDRAKEILKQVRIEQIYRKRAQEGASPEELKALEEQIKAGERRIIKLEQKIKDIEDGM